ncbi:cytochrome C oxidase subunit II [Bacillus sp. Marseille-P3661]|uniref:cytochrome C oxidase subunit II n=1 Tax=Bacillus sp. Marseille-P3661 TaxID=1936234 RepID=UPI000C83A97A|nr:cytochrome C oxidase subunit II [Bacillus sp. Marseille-P3661]
MYQQAAWVITLLLSGFIIFIFLFVLTRSSYRVEYSGIQKKWYFIRNIWFFLLFSIVIIVSYFTLQDLPFERVEAKGTPIDVNITALQFGFDTSEDTFKVGDYVAFHVTSMDVNHGFGLYDENMNIVAQTQAMPEYINTVYYEFSIPGTYTILCMEYCGIAHHAMTREITVIE